MHHYTPKQGRRVSLHRLFQSLLLAICSATAVSPCLSQAEANTPPTLAEQIESDASASLPQASWGMVLEDAESGQVLYAHDAEHLFIPASSTKLLTAVAALTYLGSDFRFVTSLNIVPAQLKDNKIDGNLYFVFHGDPSLTSKDVQQLITQIAAANIKVIKGNLIIDNSAYPKPYYPLGISLDDLPYCYGTPAIAAIVDQNCLAVQVVTEEKGKPIPTKTFTNTPDVKVIDQLGWLNPNKPDICTFDPILRGDNLITLSGCLPKHNKQLDMTVPNPLLLLRQKIAADLASQHIALLGQIVTGTAPHNASGVLAQHTSEPLAHLLMVMLKHSNNLYAATLTKTLGRANYQSGTNKAGVTAIKAILGPLAKINFADYVLEDGAGLSRYDLLSPQVFAHVLYAVYHSPTLSEVIIPALPIGGKDGTLGARFRDTALQGKVFAKTGTMTGVSSLSGYMLTQNNRMLIFSIMTDGVTGSQAAAKDLQDTILQIIYSYNGLAK